MVPARFGIGRGLSWGDLFGGGDWGDREEDIPASSGKQETIKRKSTNRKKQLFL